jgi:hypothetical protein
MRTHSLCFQFFASSNIPSFQDTRVARASSRPKPRVLDGEMDRCDVTMNLMATLRRLVLLKEGKAEPAEEKWLEKSEEIYSKYYRMRTRDRSWRNGKESEAKFKKAKAPH